MDTPSLAQLSQGLLPRVPTARQASYNPAAIALPASLRWCVLPRRLACRRIHKLRRRLPPFQVCGKCIPPNRKGLAASWVTSLGDGLRIRHRCPRQVALFKMAECKVLYSCVFFGGGVCDRPAQAKNRCSEPRWE